MTNDRNDILTVIPTYNNERTVARVIADVRATARTCWS